MKNTVLIKTYRDNQDHLPKCRTREFAPNLCINWLIICRMPAFKFISGNKALKWPCTVLQVSEYGAERKGLGTQNYTHVCSAINMRVIIVSINVEFRFWFIYFNKIRCPVFLRNINELLILNLLHKNVFNHSSNTAWVSLNNSTWDASRVVDVINW